MTIEAFRILHKLQVLSMESNRLTMLPDGLMQCLALQQLNVTANAQLHCTV
jgi:Leucine-rich repeat (LRR) protein